jgi:protein involved in polysaccharide export with SLBB domain
MIRGGGGALLAVLAWTIAWGGFALAQDRDSAANPPPRAASPFEYRLGAGDKVRIIVFGEESLTGEFFVSGAGKISFPLIGEIDALGATVPELQAAIAAKLADGYLKQPRVSAEVLNYRPFYILGEVMKPGEYPYTNGLTVLNAVATAQGFTYRADTHRVFIKRASTAAEQQSPLTPATPVLPGDTIRIGERLF